MNIREIRAIANHGRGSQMTKALHELLDINKQLLEVLEECLMWHQGDKWRDSIPKERFSWESHNDAIRRAIAKAKGEE